MDTLCVPLEDKMDSPTDKFRKIAISRMRTTYEKAYAVLVLDAELQNSRYGSAEEGLVRLTCSRWMRRAWTLEEGLLAKHNLFVRYLDQTVLIHFATKELSHSNHSWYEPHAVYQDARRYWSILMTDFHFNHEDNKLIGERFRRCWENMRWRSTSREHDKLLVFGSLLGIETSTILEVPVEQRMQKILSMITQVPGNILFEPGQRIQADGYHWGLQYFPAASHFKSRVDGVIFTRSEKGLEVLYTGFSSTPLHNASTHTNDMFFLQDSKDLTWYSIQILREEGTPTWSEMLARCSNGIGILIDDRGISTTKRDKIREHLKLGMLGAFVTQNKIIRGLPPKRPFESRSRIDCRFESRVRIQTADEGVISQLEEALQSQHPVFGGPYSTATAELTEWYQKWCIT